MWVALSQKLIKNRSPCISALHALPKGPQIDFHIIAVGAAFVFMSTDADIVADIETGARPSREQRLQIRIHMLLKRVVH